MAREILITLKSGDRIQDLVPYLEKITRPGLKVVFLIAFPANELVGSVRGQQVTM